MTRSRGHAAAGLPALRDAAASASSGIAAEVAHLALAAGGSAVDAVISGFFAAAGAEASVLLGATSAIAGTGGAAVRAFDGRPLQPGKGAARPRGFVEGAAVPDAARVAVPRAVPMLLLLHAYGGRTSLATLARGGAEAAEAAGAKRRARVIRRAGAAGVIGLRTEGVHAALLAAGNSVAGGSLTEADLDGVLPADGEAHALLRAGLTLVVGCPWAAEGTGGASGGWVVDAIAAADSRGGVAALSYAHQPVGIALPDVELCAPRAAVPVMRRVPRATPGVALRAPAPIAVAHLGRELILAFGLSGRFEAGEAPLFSEELRAEALLPAAEGGAVEAALAALSRANKAERCVAAVRSQRGARPVAVVPDAEL